MATTITMSSSLTDNKYVSASQACANNYAVIPVTWADLNGYPELVVETSIDDTDYYPAKIISDMGIDTPVKLRMIDTSGSELLTVDSIFGDTPYCRIVVYGNECDSGSIEFEINAG